MGATYRKLEDLFNELEVTDTEREWVEQMVSMCMVSRKHERLSDRAVDSESE